MSSTNYFPVTRVTPISSKFEFYIYAPLFSTVYMYPSPSFSGYAPRTHAHARTWWSVDDFFSQPRVCRRASRISVHVSRVYTLRSREHEADAGSSSQVHGVTFVNIRVTCALAESTVCWGETHSIPTLFLLVLYALEVSKSRPLPGFDEEDPIDFLVGRDYRVTVRLIILLRRGMNLVSDLPWNRKQICFHHIMLRLSRGDWVKKKEERKINFVNFVIRNSCSYYLWQTFMNAQPSPSYVL